MTKKIVCIVCNCEFSPISVRPDGTPRYLYERKRCFTCLPLKDVRKGVHRGVRECAKCKISFRIFPIINGKRCDLSDRKYCISCLPFGNYNSYDLTRGLEKECKMCRKIFPIREFQRKKRVKGLYRTRYDNTCRPCLAEKSRLKHIETKRLSVNYLGGKCARCGYQRCLSALDFHHKDSSTKEFEIGSKVNFEKIKEELDKCELLCRNCHAEHHHNTPVYENK